MSAIGLLCGRSVQPRSAPLSGALRWPTRSLPRHPSPSFIAVRGSRRKLQHPLPPNLTLPFRSGFLCLEILLLDFVSHFGLRAVFADEMAFLSTFVSFLTLLALCAFGFYSMHSLIYRNGYAAALERLRDHGPHLLPGTDVPLLREYTGIRPIDYQLTVLQCVFANITDGSAPALSLFSFYFAGQLVPALAVFLAESYRSNQSFLFKLYVACHFCLKCYCAVAYPDNSLDLRYCCVC
jgi:hypothetical protein